MAWGVLQPLAERSRTQLKQKLHHLYQLTIISAADGLGYVTSAED